MCLVLHFDVRLCGNFNWYLELVFMSRSDMLTDNLKVNLRSSLIAYKTKQNEILRYIWPN